MTPDEELVERVAIECHHASCANVPRFNPDYRREDYPFELCPTPAQEAWRAIAQAALSATPLASLQEQLGRKDAALATFGKLLASIWFYGDFKAKTHNERMLQQHMESLGFWPIANEAALFALLDKPALQPPSGKEATDE